MYSVHLCTTSDRELPPPDFGAGLTWERLTEVLRREVSPQAASLLAEPVQDATRGQTQWHVDANTDPRPLAELGEAERAALLSRLGELRGQILKYAEKLEAAGSEAGVRLANALRAALQVPSEDAHVWSVGGLPVLSAWGRRAAGFALPAARIVARTKSPIAAEGPGATIIGTARPRAAVAGIATDYLRGPLPWWLLWLLFALLLAIIFYYLLAACAIDLPILRGLTDRCPVAARAGNLADLRERNASLRTAIEAKERELATARADCTVRQVEHPTPGADTSAGTDTHTGIDTAPDATETRERVDRAQGTHGPMDITLAWNGREDLDLHVDCPGGQISYNSRTACGGVLEIDRNANAAMEVDTPVEHASWAEPPPPGEYRVWIVFYNRRGQPERGVPYTVVIREGDQQRELKGVATELEKPIVVTTFQR
jgi:hypothetical protein